MAPPDDLDEHVDEGGGASSTPPQPPPSRFPPTPPENLARVRELGLLPIRRRVLLPGGLLRLTIGRPKSVSASRRPRVRLATDPHRCASWTPCGTPRTARSSAGR